MAMLISSPATVSVTSFPYSLPTSPGQVVLIGVKCTNRHPAAAVQCATTGITPISVTTAVAFSSETIRKVARGQSPARAVTMYRPAWRVHLRFRRLRRGSEKDNANGIAWRNDDLSAQGSF